MHANSRPVYSSQPGIHPALAGVVERHARHPYRKPVAEHSRAAFDDGLRAWRAAGEPPLILDSGCGVGLSTLHLAAAFPDHFVIGIDRSEHRLQRRTRWPGALPQNRICLRADLTDFWRLLLDAGVRPRRHYILYPNPWPRSDQLLRRWHGHPVFPAVTALGGYFECRSNWRIYIDECAAALTQITGQPVVAEAHCLADAVGVVTTPFEAKYAASGHALWRCRALLDPPGN